MDQQRSTQILTQGGHSIDEIRSLIEQGRENLATMGLSKSHSTALKRGSSLIEKQSAWPFDYYQCTNWYPVDYTYWTRDITTDLGKTQLITMHAQCYTEEGDTFPADQVCHRAVLREAHKRATKSFINIQRDPTQFAKYMTKKDEWAALQRQLLPPKMFSPFKNLRRR